MSQHDYVIANGTGAAVRSDLNNALAAIVSNNSGATEPTPAYAYQWWPDTTTGNLKLRNGANNAWITIGPLASTGFGFLSSGGTLTAALGSASTPGITFTGDLNTGIYSPGADQLSIATNGVVRSTVGSTGNSSYAATTTSTPYAFSNVIATSPPAHIATFSSNTSTFGTTNESNASILVAGNNGSNSASISIGLGKPSTYGLHDVGFLSISTINTMWAGPNIGWKWSTNGVTTINGVNYKGYEWYNNISDNQIAFTFHHAITAGSGSTFRIYSSKTSNLDTKVLEVSSASGANFSVDNLGYTLIGQSTINANGAKLQASGGITFPATQVASADPNTLDDYEEGTWTPAIAGTTLAGAGTYSVQVGRYTKIGNTVTAHFNLTWSAHTGTGNMLISGLPFTSANVTNLNPAAVAYTNNLTITGVSVILVTANATTGTINSVNNGTAAALAIDTAATLTTTIIYQTA